MRGSIIGDGRPEARNFELDLSRGLITGIEDFEKYGRHPGMSAVDLPQDVWNGLGEYTGFPLGAAETMEISSSSDLDTAAGTGARTVEISRILDGNYVEQGSVTIALNGNPAGAGAWVPIDANPYLRASRICVKTAGSGGTNAGTITLRHTVTVANIFAVMPIGSGQTAIGCSTIPAGKTLYLDRIIIGMIRANGSAGASDVTVRARPLGGVFNAIKSPSISNSKDYKFENNGHIVLTEKTDFKIRNEDASDNNTVTTCEYYGRLVKN